MVEAKPNLLQSAGIASGRSKRPRTARASGRGRHHFRGHARTAAPGVRRANRDLCHDHQALERKLIPNSSFLNLNSYLALSQVVNLDDADAGSAVLSGENRGELAGRQGGEDGGLVRVRGGKTACGQERGRGGVVGPVIVCDQGGAIGVVQLERGIGQQIVQAELTQRWSKAADRRPGYCPPEEDFRRG